MKKKKMAIILLALVLIFFPYIPISADEVETVVISTPITSQNELQDAINGLGAEGGAIWLSQDLILQSTIYFPVDSDIVLDGRGHKLTLANNVESRHISISGSNNNITLRNLTLAGNGRGRVGGGLSVSGSVVLEQCTIENNYAPNGGGIMISSGMVLIKDGTKIVNNGSYSYGGGVHISSNGVLTAYDSAITGNSAVRGGGIYATGGSSSTYSVTLDNCNVSENTAAASGNELVMGGGIAAEGENTGMKVMNSQITKNSSGNSGGGIYAGGMIELGNSDVTGNKADGVGGGLHIRHKALITDGTIMKNVTPDLGGGIYVEDGALSHFSITGTAFGENEANNYVDWDSASIKGVSFEIYKQLLDTGTVDVSAHTLPEGAGYTEKTNVFNNCDISIDAKTTVTLKPEGGAWTEDNSTESLKLEYFLGDRLDIPSIEKTGFMLAGWVDESGQTIGEDYIVEGAAILTAQWAEAAQPTPADDDGQGEQAGETPQGTETPQPTTTPTPVQMYTITFALQGSNDTRQVEKELGDKLEEPPVNLNNHKLLGWFINGGDTAWDFANDTVTGNLRLEARFEKPPQKSAVDQLAIEQNTAEQL